MNASAQSAVISMAVAPLRRKQLQSGSVYTRPKEIESRISALLLLPLSELVELAHIKDKADSRYLPSECLLYFVRRLPAKTEESAVSALFTILRERVLAAVPIRLRRVAGSLTTGELVVDSDVSEAVLDKFQEMLCRDQRQYEEQLDFYECRFNSALACVKASARLKVHRLSSCQEPLEYTSEHSELTEKVERVLAAANSSEGGVNSDFLYQSKLWAAINSLPPDERRVVELYFDDVPIDSKEAGMKTMVNILGCSEKTVRNRRDRAFEKLGAVLHEEAT